MNIETTAKGGQDIPRRPKPSRRHFHKNGAVALGTAFAAPYIIPSSALGQDGAVAPSERIVMGAIGLGGMGSNNMNVFMSKPEVQIVAVCDVWDVHREEGRKLADPQAAVFAPTTWLTLPWDAPRALTLAKKVRPATQIMGRADSAFCTCDFVHAFQDAGCWFSVTIPQWQTVTRAISGITEDAWVGILSSGGFGPWDRARLDRMLADEREVVPRGSIFCPPGGA